MQKQARDKPSARVSRRKQRPSDVPAQTFWRRCVSLVLSGDRGTPNGDLSLRPDPETMAASMRNTYAVAFGKSHKRKIPSWMLASDAETETAKVATTATTAETAETATTAGTVQTAEETVKTADIVEQDVGAVTADTKKVPDEVADDTEEEQEEVQKCDFCEQKRETATYGEDTFAAMLLCEECAASLRVDVDGTSEGAVL